MTSLDSIAPDLFEHLIFPELPNIDVVKTCKKLWAMRFVARKILIKRVLSRRGKDIRISLYSKLGTVREYKSLPWLCNFPGRFDRDLVKTAPKTDSDEGNGYGKIISVYQDKSRRSGRFTWPLTWFFSEEDIITTDGADTTVKLAINHSADTLDKIIFNKPVREFELILNYCAIYTFDTIKELAFSPFLPLIIIPYTQIEIKFKTTEPNTMLTLKKTYLSDGSRTCLLLTKCFIPVIASNGISTLVKCKEGCVEFCPDDNSTLNLVRGDYKTTFSVSETF